MQMQHAHFWAQLKMSLKTIFVMDNSNKHVIIALKFFARFLANIRCDDPGDMHPLLQEVLNFILTSTSPKQNVRVHIAKLIALLLQELDIDVAIDEHFCKKLIEYMGMQLKDTAANVRLQAIETICHLQKSNDENDEVVKLLLFHMDNDPSAQVRKAAIRATVHNQFTMPCMLERMKDIDEDVRCTIFVQLGKYNARRLTTIQRLNILESGCNDRSEAVTKIVYGVVLREWLHQYNGQYVTLISAIKIYANYEEIQQLAKVSKQVMMALFK